MLERARIGATLHFRNMQLAQIVAVLCKKLQIAEDRDVTFLSHSFTTLASRTRFSSGSRSGADARGRAESVCDRSHVI
jgi:hypothetical protein